MVRCDMRKQTSNGHGVNDLTTIHTKILCSNHFVFRPWGKFQGGGHLYYNLYIIRVHRVPKSTPSEDFLWCKMTTYTRISAWFHTPSKYFRWCFTWNHTISSIIFFNHPFRGFQEQKQTLFSHFGHFWYPNAIRVWCRKKDPFSSFSWTRMICKLKYQWPPGGKCWGKSAMFGKRTNGRVHNVLCLSLYQTLCV